MFNLSFTKKITKAKQNSKQCKSFKKRNSIERTIDLSSFLSDISLRENSVFKVIKLFNKFSCLYKKQFGFTNAHSTNHSLISITEEVGKLLDNNGFFLILIW